MDAKRTFTSEQLHYLRLLSKQYPTVQAAGSEIINLRAILNLPKGTEHFMSDIHGEHEAFLHILNSCSGEVKDKLDELFGTTMTQRDRNDLATLIYYPSAKLALVSDENDDMEEWYRITLHRLVLLCRFVSVKYTRTKVRAAMPEGYRDIIDELIHTRDDEQNKREYYEKIISSIIEIGQAGDVIEAICHTIKRLTVDHLHIVGDIFDRGPRADIVMDSLLGCHSVDIQWGNHDILWMGAASGSRTLVATVLVNSIRYNNLDVIETGYGISLRPLSVFADEFYRDCDVSQFAVKLSKEDEQRVSDRDKLLAARMHKAITMILFKLESQKILRNPSFGMEDRLLLDKVNYADKTIEINGKVYPMLDTDFPTVDPADPYSLTPEEDALISQLTRSFRHSEKLQRHVRFLYSKGSLYRVYNDNLLFHGCIPMTEDGKLMSFSIDCDNLSGKAFLDHADTLARRAYYNKPGTPEREFGMDFLWWLWCGRNSPIFGRDRMTTFERRFIADEGTHTEPKNAYYRLYSDPAVCDMLLDEFGLHGDHCHIINGHVPVKSKKGESPIKAGGKLLVIDGGFCKAYQKTTGIAGYTLIYSSNYLRLVAHEPFSGREDAIRNNRDIVSNSNIFERRDDRQKIAETDIGRQLQEQIDNLLALVSAFRSGAIVESHK